MIFYKSADPTEYMRFEPPGRWYILGARFEYGLFAILVLVASVAFVSGYTGAHL